MGETKGTKIQHVKTESDKLYEGRERKSFFESEEQRNLWLRLNAERIRHFHRVVNNQDVQELGHVDKAYTHLWISNNQLIYDEYMRDAPRFSLEELAAMLPDDLLKLGSARNRETIKELFGDLPENIEEEL